MAPLFHCTTDVADWVVNVSCSVLRVTRESKTPSEASCFVMVLHWLEARGSSLSRYPRVRYFNRPVIQLCCPQFLDGHVARKSVDGKAGRLNTACSASSGLERGTSVSCEAATTFFFSISFFLFSRRGWNMTRTKMSRIHSLVRKRAFHREEPTLVQPPWHTRQRVRR